jgi:hypothetical protein
MMVKRQRLEVVLVLLAAWGVYGSCQLDLVLPVLAAVVALTSAVREGRSQGTAADRLASRPAQLTVAGACLLTGWLWRTFLVESPADAYVGYMVPIAALQTGVVLAGCLIFVTGRKDDLGNRLLRYLAWSTVVMAANIPPSPRLVYPLALFCLVSLGVTVSRWWRLARQERRFVGPLLAVAALMVMWGAATASLVVTATGVDSLMRRLLMVASEPAESLLPARVQAVYLSLGGPAPSGREQRPILEIDSQGVPVLYLRTQVFESYRNGAWRAARAAHRSSLPERAEATAVRREMVLFTELDGLVPATRELQAGTGRLERDDLGLVHSGDRRKLRKLVLYDSLSAVLPPPDPEQIAQLLAVPDSLQPLLRQLVDQVAGGATDPDQIAGRIENYFQQSYLYSLQPDLPRGEEALRLFLSERRAAYCVYFASAATLMLRSHGIPARVVGGFLAHDPDHDDRQRLVVRVRDAHAWTEYHTSDGWQRIDATPSQARDEAIAGDTGLFRTLIDRISRGWRRWWAEPQLAKRLLTPLRLVGPWVLLVAIVILLRKAARRWRRWRDDRDEQACRAPDLHPLSESYVRFEKAVVAAVGAPRKASETDAELLQRLRTIPVLSPQVPALAESFISRYRVARFGGEDSELSELQSLLHALEVSVMEEE